MRLGVLDIGSNTVHLLIADVAPGSRPQATTSARTVVGLMQYLTRDASIAERGVRALIKAIEGAVSVAQSERLDQFLTTATSAVREARNGSDIIARIEKVTGQKLHILNGEEEARYTFLAVRRWFGWSAGRILLFDIGGGSLEIASGTNELPEYAASVPLGAGRMTARFLPKDPPGEKALDVLREHVEKKIAPVAKKIAQTGKADHVVGSSKAIRSLAKLAGDRVPGWSGMDRMILNRKALGSWIPRLGRIPAMARQELPGITAERATQIVAGAVVLHASMKALNVTDIEVSPWALREGLLLRSIESFTWNQEGEHTSAEDVQPKLALR